MVSRPILGWALAAVGALAIIIGYWGVANEALVAKQIPYLVSGGIGGMVLVAVGAFLLGTDDVRRQLGRVERLEQLVEDLHGALLVQADGEVARPLPPASNGAADSAGDDVADEDAGRVVALARGRSYHRPGCAMVAGKDVQPVGRAEVDRRNLSACSMCEPAHALVR
jgi:hypothetical protein